MTPPGNLSSSPREEVDPISIAGVGLRFSKARKPLERARFAGWGFRSANPFTLPAFIGGGLEAAKLPATNRHSSPVAPVDLGRVRPERGGAGFT